MIGSRRYRNSLTRRRANQVRARVHVWLMRLRAGALVALRRLTVQGSVVVLVVVISNDAHTRAR